MILSFKERYKLFYYKLFYKLPAKKYYWYQVKFVYRDKPSRRIIFDWQDQIGLSKQSTINNHREIKKIAIPLHKRYAVKHLLCNGILSVEPICYLGRFKLHTWA